MINIRNGGFLLFDGGNVQDATEKQLQKWLTSEDTLHIIGVIDEVNLKMLNNILEEEDHCFVFFYAEKDPDAHAILTELEGRRRIFFLSMTFHFRLKLSCYIYIILIFTWCIKKIGIILTLNNSRLG